MISLPSELGRWPLAIQHQDESLTQLEAREAKKRTSFISQGSAMRF